MHLPNAQALPTRKDEELSSANHIGRSRTEIPPSMHPGMAHGKDGGFLTYFFGNPGGSPDAHSRSSSPVRTAVEREDEQVSNKSNEEVHLI